MEEGDEIAAEARRIAEERSYSLERFLAVLDRGLYQDYEIWRLPPSQIEILLPPLRTMARERDGAVRLNAAYALLQLNDPVGCEIIVACLRAPRPELRNGALDRLSWLGRRTKDEHEQGTLSAAAADAILAGLNFCLADPNPRTRARAVQQMLHVSTPRALDRLTELLGATDPVMRIEAAVSLGWAGLDRGALAILDELLHQPIHPMPFPGDLNRGSLVRALVQMCRSGDPEVGARAAAVATRVVRNNLTDGNEIANHIWNLLDGIAASKTADEPALLREVLASEVDGWARGVALKRLAELSGQEGVALLLSALPDPALRSAALEGLTSLMLKARDPQVVNAIAQEIAREKDEDVSKLVNAYLAAGGGSIELMDSVAARVDDHTALTIFWLRTGITPRKAAEWLRPAVVGRGPTDEKLKEIEACWREKPDAINTTFAILDRFAVILFKTVDGIPDHAEVVTELAEITEHRFVVEAVVQTVESEDELRIRFIHNGVGYVFPVRHHGRYINLDDVLAGLNGVLDRLGFPERFISIDVADVAAVVVFVREAFFTAVEKLRIPLNTDRIAAGLPCRAALPSPQS